MKIVITAGGTSEKIDDENYYQFSTDDWAMLLERLFYSSTQMSWKQSTTSMERGLDIRSTRR